MPEKYLLKSGHDEETGEKECTDSLEGIFSNLPESGASDKDSKENLKIQSHLGSPFAAIVSKFRSISRETTRGARRRISISTLFL